MGNVKYVLMFVDTEEYAKEPAAVTDEERARVVRQVEQWFADPAGKVPSGNSRTPSWPRWCASTRAGWRPRWCRCSATSPPPSGTTGCG
ncbi:hypothetical protein ACTMTI_28520 [Nonomuraea sp. H19]|uniref:hypothetical protein n=1 Tax=Nonomuraea sp. H19 TaxID=3452206 RepID=UPI003F8B38D0